MKKNVKSATPAPPTEDTFLKDSDLEKRYSVSKQTIVNWVSKGNFPPPVKLSPGCSRWHRQTVAEWEAARMMEV